MKIHKYLISLATAAVMCATTVAQETCPLPIMVDVDNADGVLTEANIKLIRNKLKQLVASDGFGSDAEISHLCLKATVSENGDKQVISGNRMVVTGSYDVYLVLTNLFSGENFGADNITVHGAGNNENRLIQSAVARINPSNKELKSFLQNSRVKVFDYYRSHIPSIIRQAKSESRLGNYDKALYLLSTIPPCVEGQEEADNVMLDIFQEYIDVDCNKKLAAARSIWASTQNEEGARAAAAYLAAIDSRSSCSQAAAELLEEISDRIDDNLRRAIALEDEDRALQAEQLRNENNIRQQEIDAIREIAKAYAQSVLGSLIPKEQNSDANSGNNSKKDSPVVIINN